MNLVEVVIVMTEEDFMNEFGGEYYGNAAGEYTEFDIALSWAKEGGVISREAWEGEAIVYVDEDEDIVLSTPSGVELYYPSPESLQADDWYLVDDTDWVEVDLDEVDEDEAE